MLGDFLKSACFFIEQMMFASFFVLGARMLSTLLCGPKEDPHMYKPDTIRQKKTLYKLGAENKPKIRK